MKNTSPLLRAFLYMLTFVCIQLFTTIIVTAVVKLLGHSEWLTSPYFLIGTTLLFSIVSLIVFVAYKWATPTKDYMASRPISALIWCAIAALGTVIPSIYLQEHMPELPNLVEQQMGDMMNAKGGYFVICILVPLAEELVFRGAILRTLLKWKPQQHWAMIAISALLFALVHMNPAQMPHAFVIGLLLGWMYYRTDSIAPGVAYHWANNTVAYILFKLYPSSDTRLVDVFGTERTVGAAVLFSLLILLPALYQLYLRLDKKQPCPWKR